MSRASTRPPSRCGEGLARGADTGAAVTQARGRLSVKNGQAFTRISPCYHARVVEGSLNVLLTETSIDKLTREDIAQSLLDDPSMASMAYRTWPPVRTARGPHGAPQPRADSDYLYIVYAIPIGD